MSTKYRTFIKDLCDDLTTGDVAAFIFLLGDIIPAGKIETATNSMKLFELLERENIISIYNVDKLEDYFSGIRRMDLIEKLEKYKEHIPLGDERKENDQNINSIQSIRFEAVKLPKEDDHALKSIENIDDTDGTISPSSHSYRSGFQVTKNDTDTCASNAISVKDTEKMKFFPSKDQYFPPSPSTEVKSSPKMQRGRSSSPSPSLTLQKLLPPDYFKRSISPKCPETRDTTNTSPTPATGVGMQNRTPPPKFASQQSSQYVGPEEYDMGSSPHGNCIIFSNRFDETVTLPNGNELSRRTGTEKDVELLQKTFEFLNFTVSIHRNQSGNEIISKLRSYAQQKEQENNDSFVCCVLSHGYEGGFYGNDGKEIESKMIKNIFTGDCCPSLVTKPKLFFIQACQGDNDGKYARLEADGGSSPIAQDHVGDTGYDFSRSQVYKENIAADADILFFMATTPGTTSWRDTATGSWFVQTLCKVFQEKAHTWNLMDMLLEVNNKIAFKQGRLNDTTIAKQMSNLCENTLRKQLRFFRENFIGTTNQQKVPAES